MADSSPRRSVRPWLSAAVAGSLLLLVVGWSQVWREQGSRVLAAQPGLKWYRGNLHTHTLWSDGDDYPEMVAAWYRDREYSFLAFTDHNVLPTSERWTVPDKNKGGKTAYEKLKARFSDWVDERTVDGVQEVRLRRFDEVDAKLAEPGRFLLIQGEEISDKFGRSPIHLNATNVREVVPPLGGRSVTEVIQNNVDAVTAQRERTGEPMMIHLNHPNFGFGVTAEDLAPVRGERFFEIYNGHPLVHNDGFWPHASTERIWDIVLTKRLAELKLPVMYGLATDDGHSYHNIPSRASEPGRGWVMVLAADLSPRAIVEAMEAGRFYASTGVSLERVESGTYGLEIEVRREEGVEYTIEFVGTRKNYDPKGELYFDPKGNPVRSTRRYSRTIGDVLLKRKGTRARYEFSGDELYVRARVVSSQLHPNPSRPGEFERAWSQPVVGPAAPVP